MFEVLSQLNFEVVFQELMLGVFDVEGGENDVDQLPVGFFPSLEVTHLIGLFPETHLFKNLS